MSANGSALETNPPNDSLRPCLWMIVTATSVEADPIGVRLPPRFAPKITAHHRGSPGGRNAPPARGIPATILASIAARGMLSVTELNAAAGRAEAALARIVRTPEPLDPVAGHERFFRAMAGKTDAAKGPDVGEAQA